MAIVTAMITDCPHTSFSASAQWDDAALLEIFDSVRVRKGQVPTGETDATTGQPVMRDLTNPECARFMVGSMMQGSSQNAATDKAERLAREVSATVTPATWITLS